MSPTSKKSICFLGNHTPRQCGIATFTADVAEAVRGRGMNAQIIAINDGATYLYPEEVVFEIDQEDPYSYIAAAKFVNSKGYHAVCVQHEYGIFGGEAGSYVLDFLSEVKPPVVTTLHTILSDPTPEQKRVMDRIIQLSETIVVMTRRAKEILLNVHTVEASRIQVIPHGVPEFPYERRTELRTDLDLVGRQVLLTFGLISPDKGLEYALQALPSIIEKNPEVLYLVVGATHPHVKAKHGEAYRAQLQTQAANLGLQNHVRFIDRYVSLKELQEFLVSCDIYVTPYLKREQITSGTLAYAVGCGKPVVSTNYWHAEELLDNGCGVLVPTRDAGAIAEAVNGLLGDPQKMAQVSEAARQRSKGSEWSAVGQRYVNLFSHAHDGGLKRLIGFASLSKVVEKREPLPSTNLDHVITMTDDTGILQHAVYEFPNRFEGYCVDDNARALILTCWLPSEPLVNDLSSRYLSFVHHSLKEGRFRNFMSYERLWLEDAGSEDSHGRALWSVGVAASKGKTQGARALASEVFRGGLEAVEGFTSPRAWSFAILGCTEYLAANPCDANVRNMVAKLSTKLVGLYLSTYSPDWKWLENIVAYDNARVSQALLCAGRILDSEEITNIGLESLEWLVEIQTNEKEHFSPIGSSAFYKRYEQRSQFDQQPLEAAAMIDACCEAFKATNDFAWIDAASKAMNWFLGANDLELVIADIQTGACRDGLHATGVNLNCGAESTLAFQMALAKMSELTPGIKIPTRDQSVKLL